MASVYLCSNFDFIKSGKFLDAKHKNDYPGVAVWFELASILSSNNINLLPAEAINLNHFSSTESFFIQEEDTNSGKYLYSLGAKPIFVFSAESPLFAPNFYRDLNKISKRFPNRLLFEGAHRFTSNSGENLSLFFPSFDFSNFSTPLARDSRKFACAVLSNKYWKPKPNSPTQFFIRFLNLIGLTRIPSYIRKNQLHDERLRILSFFSRFDDFDMYGSGWDNLNNLPKKFDSSNIKRKIIYPIVDKKSYISNYRFGFAMENLDFDGYITEKIFDFLTCGVVPIYVGTKSITNHIPTEVFVQYSNFASLNELNEYLRNMSLETYTKFQESGKEFLNSEQGYKFSYQGVAQQMASLILSIVK